MKFDKELTFAHKGIYAVIVIENMDITKNNAMQIWERDFGKTDEANDFAGRLIQKNDYGQTESAGGWTISNISPQTQKGTELVQNMICTHILTNSEKGDRYPSFNANERSFRIIREDGLPVIEETTNFNMFKEEALKYWDDIVGADIEEYTDFTGRRVIRRNFRKKVSKGGWDIDKYVKNKDLNTDNCYIASVSTIKERKGRPNFIANDIDWTLGKNIHSYVFKNANSIDIFNPNDILNLVYESYEEEGSNWIYTMIIRAKWGNRKGEFAKIITDMIKEDYKPLSICF